MKPKKPYHKMNADELAEATKDFERDTVLDLSRPLGPALQEKWDRSRRRRPGRPKVGLGSRAVLVTIERGLLDRADAFAAAHGLSRSELVSRGMEAIIPAPVIPAPVIPAPVIPAPVGHAKATGRTRAGRSSKVNGRPVT